jgi:hypothetical protein
VFSFNQIPQTEDNVDELTNWARAKSIQAAAGVDESDTPKEVFGKVAAYMMGLPHPNFDRVLCIEIAAGVSGEDPLKEALTKVMNYLRDQY